MNRSDIINLDGANYNRLMNLVWNLKNVGIAVREENLQTIIDTCIMNKSDIVLKDLHILINKGVVKSIPNLSLISYLLNRMVEKIKEEFRCKLERLETIERIKKENDKHYISSEECGDTRHRYVEIETEKAFDRRASLWEYGHYAVEAKPYFNLFNFIILFYGYGDSYPENKKNIFLLLDKMLDCFESNSAMINEILLLTRFQEFWSSTRDINEIYNRMLAYSEIYNRKCIFKNRRLENKSSDIASYASMISDRYEKNKRKVEVGSAF